jgi:hypothetical protein
MARSFASFVLSITALIVANHQAFGEILVNQTELGVTLSGTISSLILHNDTDGTVVAYALGIEHVQNGVTTTQTARRSPLLAIRNGQLGSEPISIPAHSQRQFLPYRDIPLPSPK